MVGRGRGKRDGRPRCFLLGSPKSFLLKMGRKLEWRKNWRKCPCVLCTWVSSTPNAFFSPPTTCTYTNFFLFYLKMCYFFVLFNGVIIIYLYQLHFSNLSFFLSTKQKFFISPLFHPHNQKKKREKTRAMFGCIFFIT